MSTDPISRRALAIGLTAAGVGLGVVKAAPEEEDGISHTADAIHQEVTLSAPRLHVWPHWPGI